MLETFNFGHFIPISTVDWHGRSASVLFFRGCQFRCPYCQNHAYLDPGNEIRIDEILSRIAKASPFISAVVFSGGEPTQQPEALTTFARYVKSMSLLVGLETNGVGFQVIRNMLDEKILDKLFIDIKAPLDDPGAYRTVTGSNPTMKTLENIAESLNTGLASRIEMEVRTTVFRGFTGPEEVVKIGSYLDMFPVQNLTYVLQQGLPENTLHLKETPIFTRTELLDMARSIQRKSFNEILIRTREKGEERIA